MGKKVLKFSYLYFLNFIIDFSIARQFRGMGLGKRLLSKGIESFLENNHGGILFQND